MTDHTDYLVDAYFSQVKEYVPMSREEEDQLSATILNPERTKAANAAREEAIRQLVTANLRLVPSCVKPFTGINLATADLIQEGNLGLVDAARRFDSSKGKFSAYAAWYIRHRVSRALGRAGHMIELSPHMCAQIRRLRHVETALEADYGRRPTVEEVAAETGISAAKVQEWFMLGTRPESLDAKLSTTKPESGTLLDVLADPNTISPDDLADRQDQIELLMRLVEGLSERHQNVLHRRYGMAGYAPHTLLEVSKIYGTTKERVRQLQMEATRCLRARFAAINNPDSLENL